MQWFAEHQLPVLFISGYLVLLAYHGWRGVRRTKSLDDFLVGGRSLGGMLIALSFYATFVSSVTFIGHAGKSFTRGPAWWLTCVVVFTAAVVAAWFVIAPPFVEMSRKFKALTIPDFLGCRYDSPTLRRLSGLVVVVASVAYMVAVYDGAARSLESLLHLPPLTTMAVIFVIVTAYTLGGGFHSVVATDAIQGLILFSGAIMLPVAMVVKAGGIGPLVEATKAAHPAALELPTDMPLAAMIGLALGVGLKIVVEPRQLSRFYGLSSGKELRLGRWIAPSLLFLTYVLMLPVGFLAHAYVPLNAVTQRGKVETDLVVPYLLDTANLLGPVGGAFFLTALAAAAMSSLDSVLLVAASSADHDIVTVGRRQQSSIGRTRAWVFVLSAVAAALAITRQRGIVEMSSFSGSLYAACFLPALIVGLFWNGGTRAAALGSLILGFTVTMTWFFAKKSSFAAGWAWLHEVYLGLGLSLVTYFVVSLATRGGDGVDDA